MMFRLIESDTDDGEREAADKPLTFCDITQWSTREPPLREWAVQDRFPLRNVSLISGEGAVGKSILIMQLGVAHALGRDWIGTLPEPGPFLYLNAEDEEAELHRRLADIAAHFGTAFAELKSDVHILSLAGKDAVLGMPIAMDLSSQRRYFTSSQKLPVTFGLN